MAYSGTTAASSLANPPVNLVRAFGNTVNQSGMVIGTTNLQTGGGNGLWHYSSTDTMATIISNLAYFTDGQQLGMRMGDVIFVANASTVASSAVTMGIGLLGTTNSTAGWTIMTAGNIASS